MTFKIEYFHERVLAEIESWPVDVLADYARIVELLAEHGVNLRLPHSKAFGDGLFELRPRGKAGIGRAFYCFMLGHVSLCYTPSSRKHSKPQNVN
jgi:phage-related protein